MIKIKPEVGDIKYWIHLIIIVLIVYFLLNMFVTTMPITLKSVASGVVIVGIADIIAHTILKLD